MALQRPPKTMDSDFAQQVPSQSLDSSAHDRPKPSSRGHLSSNLLLLTMILTLGIMLLAMSSSISGIGSTVPDTGSGILHVGPDGHLPKSGSARYLYWGKGIDCPGKHCRACEGLGHQESSLRCALEEAMFLHRTFVLPSGMCINHIHNDKGILHHPSMTSEERWAADFCAMDSLYDIGLMSKTVPVILDNSKEWYWAISVAKKLGNTGMVHVHRVDRKKLRNDSFYRDALIINRIAGPLPWFDECKDRHNHSAIMLPYSFLPSMAAKSLQDAAEQIKRLLGDYDAMHVRRGDKIMVQKGRFGVNRTRHPHLDRDTRPEAILQRISKWIPEGRTIFIASNERTPGFFSPLSVRYRLAYSSNFTSILDPVVRNNYQLFMAERLVMAGAKTFVKTHKEEPSDLSLTDDPKKNLRNWQIPVYTFDKASPS